jgi:hypothetical protein
VIVAQHVADSVNFGALGKLYSDDGNMNKLTWFVNQKYSKTKILGEHYFVLIMKDPGFDRAYAPYIKQLDSKCAMKLVEVVFA